MQTNRVFSGLGGSVQPRLIRPDQEEKKVDLAWKLRNFPNLWRGLWREWVAKALGLSGLHGRLSAKLVKADGSVVNYGLISARVVTTAFVNFMVDNMQAETAEWGDFKYHDSGVGTTAEAVGDTDIETTDAEGRATGTQVDGASANIYRSVGTISYTTTKAITEHGLFSQSTGTTLMDRSVFTAINVVNGDSIQFTFDLTIAAGS